MLNILCNKRWIDFQIYLPNSVPFLSNILCIFFVRWITFRLIISYKICDFRRFESFRHFSSSVYRRKEKPKWKRNRLVCNLVKQVKLCCPSTLVCEIWIVFDYYIQILRLNQRSILLNWQTFEKTIDIDTSNHYSASMHIHFISCQ